MLTKKNRLKKQKDFERVYQKGKGFRQNSLFLKIIENDLGAPRFGFVVSTKVSKKAVERNKLKRRLREIVRRKLPETKQIVDGILTALPGAEKRSFEQLRESVDKLFEKAKI